jgi:predicted nucleotidyltransferase
MDVKQIGQDKIEAVQARYRLVIQALANAFAERLKTVVLFGSQARQSAHPSSDHDLLVVVERLPQEPLARQRAVRGTLLPILDQLPGSISLMAKTPEEFAANLTPLLLDVCVDGLCLYGAAYFEPYRKRALAALKHSNLRRQRIGGTLMWVFPHVPPGNWELSWEGYIERP